MRVNGTLVNYYFHCRRQCWLHGNRINLESNSEIVKIGKALHEIRAEESESTEIGIENIRLDKITKDYLVEVKKSDADYEAVKWQVLFYLKTLKNKGIERRGKIEFIEKKKAERKIYYEDLTQEREKELDEVVRAIETLLESPFPPGQETDKKCRQCAYFDYCVL